VQHETTQARPPQIVPVAAAICHCQTFLAETVRHVIDL